MKRLVVCCDGTWNDADSQTADTNVARIARAVHGTQNTDGVLQITLYLQGVGTTGLKVGDLVEGAVGFGIEQNIRSAYMFIAQNYVPGDEVFLFGFSRGAFTARSIAGFIAAAGLLRRERLGDLPAAWAYYRSPPPHSPARFQAERKTLVHLDVAIAFLGVWDTVGALGIPGQALAAERARLFAFHDTGPSRIVKHGCHALAIDENRHDFVPTLWTGAVPEGCSIEQVWFAGVHADVGGGYVTRGLADIPLVWMAKKAEAAGLALDWGCLPDPATLDPAAPRHDSCSGWFVADRFRRTWREVAGSAPTNVPFNESLYVPRDERGGPLPTIGQAVHRSALRRHGGQAPLCTDDASGGCSQENYAPLNLQPFFDAAGQVRAGLVEEAS